MACTPAPACQVVLREADIIAPNRNDKSDGICASPKHTQQNPTSDHETGEAVDLTHDPANGCDVDALFARIIARRDPRVKYLIRSKRICRSYDKPGIPAWTWAPYTGSNPHDKHGHISIVHEARNDTSSWFGPGAPPIHQQENDLTPEEHATLDATRTATAQLVDVMPTVVDLLRSIDAKLDAGAGGGITAAAIADELARRLKD